jgi:hypothetical protein
MAFTPITGFTIIWDTDNTPGEVKLNLDADPDIDTKWKVYSLAEAAAWATLLSSGTTREWDQATLQIRVTG